MPQYITQFLDRVSMFPRAFQWAIWAGIGTVLFLMWDASIAEVAANWSSRADTIEMQIREVNKPVRLTSSTKNAITAFGEVQLPRDKAEGASGLTNAIHDILAESNVRNDEFKRTKTTRMRSSALPGIAQSGQQIEQVIGDLHFDARQSEILDVLAALESSPWVDSVSSVRLTRMDNRLIKVNLSLEAWVVTKKRGRNTR
ncbi:MAG: hypothetical protein QGI78_05430 [Phycisphaerales bacterium]|jgi:hypothetical protein|nr:hypothetical protein [Phycisphaerales bacterium]